MKMIQWPSELFEQNTQLGKSIMDLIKSINLCDKLQS